MLPGRLCLCALAVASLVGCGPKESDRGPRGQTSDTSTTPVEVRPHVVVLLLDDVGWTGPSSGATNLGNGSDFHETPAFDSLAAVSVAFDAAYASPGCLPGRGALMSGQHATRTKIYANYDTNRADPSLTTLVGPNTRERLELDVVTIAEVLSADGYRTGHFGKWHIGEHGADGPEEQGFDLNVGGTADGLIRGGADGHFAQDDGSFMGLPNLGANGQGGQFAADRVTDEALAWLGAPDEPSFAVISHFSVHTPIQAPQADVDYYGAKPPGTRHSEVEYAAMLANLDENIGRVVEHLEQTDDPRTGGKLIDNTLVVLLSDNGGTGGFASEGVDVSRELTNQEPLRSGKGTVWEGGVRVPMLIRWDPAGSGGRIVHTPVQHIDLYPTIAAVSGAPLDDGHILDGESLVPLIDSEQGSLSRDRIYLHFPAYLDYIDVGIDALRETPSSVVWSGNWKLKWVYETEQWQLYDLATDIGETANVAAAHPDVVHDLGRSLVDWLVETEADLPFSKATQDVVGLPDPG